MSGHTPGPWTVEPNGYGSIVCKDGKSMVAVWPEGLGGPSFPHEANARLIAAAPDLLAALEMVRDADNDCRDDGLPCIPALARGAIDGAIAKATGDQP